MCHEPTNGAVDGGKTIQSFLKAGLVVSQFTLYGDAEKGRRPSFIAAARPEVAVPLYERFIAQLRDKGLKVESGEFGAMMQVEIHNDGPVTLVLVLEREKGKRKREQEEP